MSRANEGGFWKLVAACSAGGVLAQAPIVVTVAFAFRFSFRALIVPCLFLLAAGVVTAIVLFWARQSDPELFSSRAAVASFVFLLSYGMAYLASAGLLHLVSWIRAAAVWLPVVFGVSLVAAWYGYHLPREKWRYFSPPWF
jgi:hypothetical protein